MNDSSSDKRDWTCLACPLGGYCVGAVAWQDVKPKYGWWRIHESNETTKSRPPVCLAHEENKKRAQPACVFQKCLYPHACHGAPNPGIYKLQNGNTLYDPANDTSNLTETCDESKGYSNNCTDENNQTTQCRLCASCIGVGELRYKRAGDTARCKLCPDPGMNKFLLCVGFVVMVFGSSIMVCMEITSERSKDETSDVVKKIIGKSFVF